MVLGKMKIKKASKKPHGRSMKKYIFNHHDFKEGRVGNIWFCYTEVIDNTL